MSWLLISNKKLEYVRLVSCDLYSFDLQILAPAFEDLQQLMVMDLNDNRIVAGVRISN